MADIIFPLPGCSKRKSGKSIGVEEQQIILNVAKYFQEESKSGNNPQFRAGAVIAKTAAALDSVEKLFRKKREELPEDFWRKSIEHVKKIEKNYWELDRIQDNKVEQLIIKLRPMDSSSSEMESFSESSNSSDSDQP